VDDNPIIDHERGSVYHGGNFHGDQVSIEMDKLRIAIAKLSVLIDRQLNYLLNDRINERFPAFLNMGQRGTEFGMQGMQYVATSTTAENQMLANPIYVHSIPNNNDNQDVVSMGSNAALMTARVIRNTAQVMAVQAIALAQATDIGNFGNAMSAAGADFHRRVRSVCPPIGNDVPHAAMALVKEEIFLPAWA
jgi:histidine ammonia-lyase